jgi:cobalt-zinc-cadmium efflux system protein
VTRPEAAPAGVDPDALGDRLVALPQVTEIHDLHIWQITSGQTVLSAHVLVDPSSDCHTLGRDLEGVLRADYAITHTTLQVDHAGTPAASTLVGDGAHALPMADDHCDDAHGPVHSNEPHAH